MQTEYTSMQCSELFRNVGNLPSLLNENMYAQKAVTITLQNAANFHSRYFMYCKLKLSVFILNVAYVVKRAKNVKLDRCDHGQVTDASAAFLSLVDQLVANMVSKYFHNSGMKYDRVRIPNGPKFITPDISIFVNL